jgi:hypothetical protein
MLHLAESDELIIIYPYRIIPIAFGYALNVLFIKLQMLSMIISFISYCVESVTQVSPIQSPFILTKFDGQRREVIRDSLLSEEVCSFL